MIFNTIFYYFFFVSAVYIYGIGFKKVMIISNFKNPIFHILQTMLTCSVVTSLSYLVTFYILGPLKLTELFPLVIALIQLIFTIFSSIIFSKLIQISFIDIGIAFPAIFIGVQESCSITHSLIIVLCCCVSYYAAIIFLHSIRERIKSCHPVKEFKNGSLILISAAVIMIAFYAINISWIVNWR
ncbi:MAG: hypothetical protein ACTTHG_00935 [Treponemataceae bacterium]